jgi:hypothetical protein
LNGWNRTQWTQFSFPATFQRVWATVSSFTQVSVTKSKRKAKRKEKIDLICSMTKLPTIVSSPSEELAFGSDGS